MKVTNKIFKPAFTMIELVFCIVILGILASVAASKMNFGADVNSAAASISADMTYASAMGYNKPIVASTSLHPNGLGTSNLSTHNSVNIRKMLKSQSGFLSGKTLKSIKRLPECKSEASCLSYSVYTTSSYLRRQVKSERKFIKDWLEPGKKLYFPISSSFSKNRLSTTRVKTPKRLDINGTFGSEIAMFFKYPGVNKIMPSGKGAKFSSLFHLDPLTGGFLLTEPRHRGSGKKKKSGSGGGKRSGLTDAEYRKILSNIVDFTRVFGGRIVIQVRDKKIATPKVVGDYKKLNPRSFSCIELNANTNFARIIPRDSQGRQVAFVLYKPNGSGFAVEKVYCHELAWSGHKYATFAEKFYARNHKKPKSK